MKNIFKILAFILLLWGAGGCSDVLVEAPKAVAVETFYNTAAEVETAVNAAYQELRAVNGISGQLGAQVEAYTDYSYGRGSYQVLSDFQGLNSTNIPRTDEGWRLFYLSIRNANLVIQNAPKGSRISQADIVKYVAEAKFLRAYNYFWLVRNWGGVPIRTEATLTEPNVKRSTAEEVYKLIIADLKEAETNLPDKGAQVGRATKWAAKAALAEVYFTLNQYAEARDKADEIIKSGQFSLIPVTVAADFDKVFGPTVVTSPEEIFYLKMTRQNNQGMYLAMFAHHPGTRLHGAGGFFAHYTDSQTNPVYRTWDNNDLRKSYNWVSWNIGLGANSLLCKKFSDPLAPSGTAAGNDFPIYRYADVLLLYAEAACRAGNAPTAAAMEALNQVRRRAYGRPITTPSTVDFKLADYTAATFNDLVLRERGYETQYEGKRWLDLKRLGTPKLREIIKAATGKDVADKHLLWPIPVGELNFNTALDPCKDQNPGY
ncbi:RagB/SusD family nutrient uptake outer membrane protein [Runella slithyformis]|uniref:RagB/SusD domain-containing protein n=1 Tax=Runella slithyformis (strain ATCC 29530 / DSM 19594 / LMG 11500 / NCIMB 11436 / LSU 4) TaxID=761193 RepID=A0A7U3ZRE6_RUNSL|nr:RagB/SusD family nutrient uptake outer membrane protein [Runella slithyformis]AEI51980.1 RagB/SusD domain-containing protein [Runella slithyformis DSM 19594]